MSASSTTIATEEFGAGWNRFWFTPSDPLPLCVLRIGVGLCTLLYLGTLTSDVAIWFSNQGLVPPALYERLVIGGGNVNRFAFWSYFNLLQNDSQILAVHWLGILIVALFTLGCFTRVTSVLSWLVLLQYVHRAPFVTGQTEPVLALLLLYLMIGPCGDYLSIDAWRGGTKQVVPSRLATISLRLIQVHLAAFYLMMGTAKLHGDIWWRGEGVWALIAMTRSRLVDLSGLRDKYSIINLWSHAIVLYELTFAALIWPRATRNLMLIAGIVLWLLLLPISGLVNFCLLMIVAKLAYVPAGTWHTWLAKAPLRAA